MSAAVLHAAERLWRRALYAIGRGRVTLVDDTGVVQILQADFGPMGPSGSMALRDNTPRLAEFGFASNPPAGAHFVALSIGGDRSNTVVIATGHQATRLKNLAPGDSALYDSRGAYVWLTPTGIVIEAKNQPVTINDATQVTINASAKVRLVTPRFEVTGDIIDNCDAQSATVKALRTAYDAHHHTGVTAGAGTSGTTDQTV
ncbi:MAG TPA: phage baseplate assembly protein [Caulobacteraceae bacterium]|nr:phage baseplate assembly protein [Caulobacteraceae bacterium]